MVTQAVTPHRKNGIPEKLIITIILINSHKVSKFIMNHHHHHHHHQTSIICSVSTSKEKQKICNVSPSNTLAKDTRWIWSPTIARWCVWDRLTQPMWQHLPQSSWYRNPRQQKTIDKDNEHRKKNIKTTKTWQNLYITIFHFQLTSNTFKSKQVSIHNGIGLGSGFFRNQTVDQVNGSAAFFWEWLKVVGKIALLLLMAEIRLTSWGW